MNKRDRSVMAPSAKSRELRSSLPVHQTKRFFIFALTLIFVLGLAAATELFSQNVTPKDKSVAVRGDPSPVSARASSRPSQEQTPGSQPSALLISFIVGTSFFVVLTLAGSWVAFKKTVHRENGGLSTGTSENLEIQDSTSARREMSELIENTEQELSELDQAIEACLLSLSQSRDPEIKQSSRADSVELKEMIRRQQRQIVQYLELISLQNKKLNTYHRENLKVRNLIRRLPVFSPPPYVTSSRELRRPGSGLTIRPA